MFKNASLKVIDGEGHGFTDRTADRVWEEITEFFEKEL